jgi:predicted NUDIX family phosphoesterase
MGKEDQIILAVERLKLFENSAEAFNGSYIGQLDYESRILNNIKWLRRGDAEIDPSHKQPIGYCLIINPTLKKVFAYRRAEKGENYHESRLAGKWSWGVGGHIEKEDILGNPIRESMKRELLEEVKMNGNILEIVPLGYINDDNDSVGKVHFGILYAAITDSTIVEPTIDHEISFGELMSFGQLEEICSSKDCNVETWSRMALDPLRNIIN